MATKRATTKQTISVSVLPGEPLDGSGRVCIHLFVPDERGPFVEPHALHIVPAEPGQPANKLVSGPTRGRLACDPKRTVAPAKHGNVATATPRSDDPRAVNCLKCMASDHYVRTMELLTAKEAGK